MNAPKSDHTLTDQERLRKVRDLTSEGMRRTARESGFALRLYEAANSALTEVGFPSWEEEQPENGVPPCSEPELDDDAREVLSVGVERARWVVSEMNGKSEREKSLAAAFREVLGSGESDPDPSEEGEHRGRSDYHARVAQRRQRLQERSNLAEHEATTRFQSARDAVAGIPFGQPILVGHHSERRHRKALEKQDTNMRRGVEASEKAKTLRSREKGVGTAGISSDDPEAVVKLKTKLQDLEEGNAVAKRINAAMRKARKAAGGLGTKADRDPTVIQAGLKAGLEHPEATEAIRRALEATARVFYGPPDLGSNANIQRTVRQRIEALCKEATAEEMREETDLFSVEEDRRENRLLLTPKSQLRKESFRWVRSQGFNWSRRDQTFKRLLNDNARSAARRVLDHFSDKD